jgi:hypothetical protein
MGIQESAAILSGRKSNCPFCIARLAGKPVAGARIMILNGFRAGMTGTVSDEDMDHRLPTTAFLMVADGDKPGVKQIVNMERDLVGPLEPRPLPDWLPPLALPDAAELDEVAVWFCDRCLASQPIVWNRASYYEVIRFCWQKRFPLTPNEVCSVLLAHGLPTEFASETQRAFIEGIELLVYTHGRRAIKKKRVKRRRGL